MNLIIDKNQSIKKYWQNTEDFADCELNEMKFEWKPKCVSENW